MSPQAGAPQLQPAPLEMADLLGCWSLVEALEDRGGVIRNNPNYGAKPTGFLHYLAEGRVSVAVANGGREPMSGTNRRMAPVEQLAESARTFDAYAGRFSLIAPDHVAHHIEISTYQNDVGKDLVRRVLLEGDRLALHIPVFEESGQTVRRWLAWQRLTGA